MTMSETFALNFNTPSIQHSCYVVHTQIQARSQAIRFFLLFSSLRCGLWHLLVILVHNVSLLYLSHHFITILDSNLLRTDP